MGSKKALLIVLGLILLSSSAIAVDFEWALGNSATEDSCGKSIFTERDSCFKVECENIRNLPAPVIGVSTASNGGASQNRCHVRTQVQLFYKDAQTAYYKTGNYARGWSDPAKGPDPIIGITDKAIFGGSCDWSGEYDCYFHGNIWVNYVDIDISGLGSVFKEDRVKSIGSIYDLMGDKLPPAGETVYFGLSTQKVMGWIGKEGEEYNAQKELLDPAADDYLNVCVDVDANGECDYKQAEPCFNAGADWYKGVCCGEDPSAIYAATNLEAVNCTYHDNLNAFCGKTLDGRWQWVPLNDDYGNIHELLACPGVSLVSDRRGGFYGCKGQSVQGVSDTLVMAGGIQRKLDFSSPWPDSTGYYNIFTSANISGTLGTHEYICSSGEIFECAGDIASYTYDQDIVAETGVTTFELLGSGGCPPNILSYWTFDDGTAKDTKGIFNGNNFGATASTGKVSGALSFDGTDRVEASGSLAAGNEFSVEAWIRPTETSGVRKIIEKGSTFKIAMDAGLLVGAVNTGAGMLDFGSRNVVPNLWHHVALTYDGSVAKLYLDGVPIEDVTTGNISWSSQPIIIGGNFIGDIDEVAIYGKVLRHSLVTLHAKNPSSYCQAQPSTTVANQYCAADGDWTADLDIKDLSSCNKAGFHWTGTMCCSEMDDIPTEYYNEHDSPRADLAKYPQGKTTAWHAGAQVESAQITLSNLGHYVTISGLARLAVETYSAESASDIGACPKLSTDIVDIAPWESKTIKILNIGESGDPCRYRWKIITAQPILALGGCWNKTFVERGHLLTPKILNYQGAFFGCALPANSPFLALKDTHTNTALVSNLPATCSNIKLDAAGPGNHSVCGPGGVWLYTNDADATVSKSIIWDPLDYGITVLSTTGCCSDDQCWDGFRCVDSGDYYSLGDSAFICR